MPALQLEGVEMDELTRLKEEIEILRGRIYRLSGRFIALCFCVAALAASTALAHWIALASH